MLKVVVSTFKSCRFGDTKCKLLTMINCTGRGERSEGTHVSTRKNHAGLRFLSCRFVFVVVVVVVVVDPFLLLLLWGGGSPEKNAKNTVL